MSGQAKLPPIDLWGLFFNATSEVIIICLFGLTVFIFWFFWSFVFPIDAKTLIKSKVGSGRRKSIILMTGDEGYSRLYLGDPLAQGVINIGTKNRPRYLMLPRPYIPSTVEGLPQVPLIDGSGNPLSIERIEELTKVRNEQLKVLENQKENNAKIPSHEEFSLKRAFWFGVNRPVYYAYSGKAIAVPPQVLSALGLPELKQEEPSIFSHWLNVLTRAKQAVPKVKNDIELLFSSLIDPRVIKTVIPNLYTDAQLRKIHNDAYTAGQESMRGGSKNFMPIFLIMIILIIGLVALKIVGVF